MSLAFEAVEDDQGISDLAGMAREIWNEYWPPIIGQDQTDYMVDLFQSEDAIRNDIDCNGYRYWFMHAEDGRLVGYTGGATETMTGDPEHDARIHHSDAVDARYPTRFFISKVYLYEQERGKHYASQAIDFYSKLIEEEGLPAMYLTVNRDNELGVRAYLGCGFYTIEDVDNPIGEGFVMTDHIMVKEAGK